MREASLADHAAIRAVLDAAFGEQGPSQIVDGVRAEGADLVELVAEVGDEIVGFVLFSRMTATPERRVAGLGPVGVRPDAQGKGWGDALCRAGIEAVRALECEAVVVLGHESYYPRFGFDHELVRLVESPFAENGAFMGLDLTPGGLTVPLKLDYPAAFG